MQLIFQSELCHQRCGLSLSCIINKDSSGLSVKEQKRFMGINSINRQQKDKFHQMQWLQRIERVVRFTHGWVCQQACDKNLKKKKNKTCEILKLWNLLQFWTQQNYFEIPK